MSNTKVVVDPAQAPQAIAALRKAMDQLWHAFDDVNKNGNMLNNPEVWNSDIAVEYRGKWGKLGPILANAKHSSQELNDRLVPYNNNINKELADSSAV